MLTESERKRIEEQAREFAKTPVYTPEFALGDSDEYISFIRGAEALAEIRAEKRKEAIKLIDEVFKAHGKDPPSWSDL